jgi:hypothetical protein
MEILLGLIAVAGGAYGLTKIFDTKDIERASHAAPGSFKFEQGAWIFVPIVGSWSQMTHGRDVMTRVCGTIFFPLDVFAAGPLLRGAGALLKMTPEALGTLRYVYQGGLGPAKQALLKGIFGAGAVQVAEVEAKALLMNMLRTSQGRSLLVVGTEGAKNHAVAYVLVNDSVWKLNGGLLKFASLVNEERLLQLSEEAARTFYQRMNTIQVVPILTQDFPSVIHWWQQRAGYTMLKAFKNAATQMGVKAALPRGCGDSLIIIMKHMAAEGMIGGSEALSKLSPSYWTVPLHVTRTLAAGGQMLVKNPFRAIYGTALQGGLKTAGISFMTGMGKSMPMMFDMNNYVPAPGNRRAPAPDSGYESLEGTDNFDFLRQMPSFLGFDMDYSEMMPMGGVAVRDLFYSRNHSFEPDCIIAQKVMDLETSPSSANMGFPASIPVGVPPPILHEIEIPATLPSIPPLNPVAPIGPVPPPPPLSSSKPVAENTGLIDGSGSTIPT